jgi:hypothetical protein
MMNGKKMMMMAKAPAGKKAASFKPCAKCPNPAKCAKAGTCLAKAKK